LWHLAESAVVVAGIARIAVVRMPADAGTPHPRPSAVHKQAYDELVARDPGD
jgi:hypothetical protein